MENANNRGALVNGAVRVLAVVGFIAVVIAGLWGSVSLARMVPGVFATLASAIVSITSIFIPAPEQEVATTTPEIANEEEPSALEASGTAPRTPGQETTDIEVFGVTGPAASDPNGTIDLAVRFIELGIVDKTTGSFTASSTPSRSMIGMRVAARFSVENVGTRTSDQWSFNAVLPTFPSHIYSSPTQQILGPGDRIEFTLGFDSFEEDNEGILVINVDPTNRINERNKDNNILRRTIIVSE